MSHTKLTKNDDVKLLRGELKMTCQLINDCPIEKLDGGTYKFCSHPGYGELEFIKMKRGLSRSTIWDGRKILFTKEINGGYYIPRCGLLGYKPKSSERGKGMTYEEWQDWVRVKCKERIMEAAERAYYYTNIEAKDILGSAAPEQVEEIIEVYKHKYINTVDRIFARIDKADDKEIKEMANLFWGISGHLHARDLVDRDAEYRELTPVIACSNDGFTQKEQAKYDVKDPIWRIYEVFKVRYRNGLNWKKIRDSIIKARDGKCEICGATNNLHVHHKISPSVNDDDALEVLCKQCHKERHDKEGRDFRKRNSFT